MEKLFQKLGLNSNEQEVYLTVLKAGKIAPQQVSRITHINRTTVYSIAKKLESLGLIVQDYGQKVRYLVAQDPKNVLVIFEEEEKKILEKKKVAMELIEELSKMKGEKRYSVPRIRFIEESDLSEYLYSEYVRWSESATAIDNTWWGFQDHSFTEAYGDFIDWSWKMSPKGLRVCFFANKSFVEEKMSKKFNARGVKEIPTGIAFDSSFWVAGNYIFMVQSRVRPHYLVEIHDEVLARNQRELFKGLWDAVKSDEEV